MTNVAAAARIAGACLVAFAGGESPRAVPFAGDSTLALDRALRRTGEEIARTTELFEDHSTWEKAWLAESDHYTVRTIDSWFLANDLATGLDVMRGHFCETLALPETPAGRARVDLVPDIATYNRLGANYDQHSSFYGSFFADKEAEPAVVAALDSNPTLLRMQITHSALHQFLAAEFPGRAPPTWINEGLAAYFSIWWDYGWGLTEFERMRDAGNLIALPRLLREDVAAYATRPQTHMMELGMLFYYLLRFRDDTRTTTPDESEQRGPFRDYLLATLRGQNTAKLPMTALLADLQKLDTEFCAFKFPR
jgi:hypothetical protein